MKRRFIIVLSMIFLASCWNSDQETKQGITIRSDTLIITDIYENSIRLTGKVKDSVLVILETNKVLDSEEVWFVVRKKNTPTKNPIFPKGFEEDTTAYSKNYNEYGSHYYDIFVSKSQKEKERLLSSIDGNYDSQGLKTVVITNWDLSLTINEDKTKLLETWVYRKQ